MRSFYTFLFIFITSGTFAQLSEKHNEEKLVNFTSSLIHYELYKDQLIALTETEGEYFIYFTDSRGAKLFESFDDFAAKSLHVDCMGNLFVVGETQAIRITVTDVINHVQLLNIASFKSSIKNCKAYFDKNLVREMPENKLVFEPITDSLYQKYPEVASIQLWATSYRVSSDTHISGQSASHQGTPADHGFLRLVGDGTTDEKELKSLVDSPRKPVKTTNGAIWLSSFQRDDSLWVFDRYYNKLLVYSNRGILANSVSAMEISRFDRLKQDRVSGDIYSIKEESKSHDVYRINRQGKLELVQSVKTASNKPYFKISNDYLYFIESSRKGETIKRIKLTAKG